MLLNNLNTKLICADMDGTLTRFQGTEIFPDVLDFICEIQPEYLAICTNQGGTGLRYAIESSGGFGKTDEERQQSIIDAVKKYMSIQDALDRVHNVAEQIRIRLPKTTVYELVAFRYQSRAGNWLGSPFDDGDYNGPSTPLQWSKQFRKPNPGMINYAMTESGVPRLNTIFIGDSHIAGEDGRGNEDLLAANAAGVLFVAVQTIRKTKEGP